MKQQYVKIDTENISEDSLRYVKTYLDTDKPIELHGVTLSRYSNTLYLVKLDRPRDIPLTFDDSLWVRLFGNSNEPQGYYIKNGHKFALMSCNYFTEIK